MRLEAISCLYSTKFALSTVLCTYCAWGRNKRFMQGLCKEKVRIRQVFCFTYRFYCGHRNCRKRLKDIIRFERDDKICRLRKPESHLFLVDRTCSKLTIESQLLQHVSEFYRKSTRAQYKMDLEIFLRIGCHKISISLAEFV